jgi:ubiquinol-cytochrome c reductase cytochrome b subunit
MACVDVGCRLSLLKQPALEAWDRHLFDYPTPSLLNFLWGFGSLGGIGLQVQIVTGIVLAMHYTPHVVCAGVSIEHILREVYGGWLLRHAHANGASLFFLAVYLHLFRGLAMGHAWRVFVWCVGVILLLLSVLTAFVGYVLPWGQMSFWGATVITSLASAFPVVGNPLVTWLWGGLSVENATLNRFLSLHYLLPFILACHSMVHLAALHQYGSNHPLVGGNPVDKSAFLTDSLIKDLVGWVLYAIGFSLYAFFTPIALGHPDNSIHANPLTTPAHIVPEWYFLAFYAILRSIPNKQAGVASVALVFFTLGLIGISGSSTFRHGPVRPSSSAFSPTIADAFHLFWILGADLLILGWSGSHCTPHAIRIGQLWSAYSFLCLANLHLWRSEAEGGISYEKRQSLAATSSSFLFSSLRTP